MKVTHFLESTEKLQNSLENLTRKRHYNMWAFNSRADKALITY